MDKRQIVIVYGESLMLAAVQTSLDLDPSFEVIVHPMPITASELQALQPRAIIFDIQAVPPELRTVLAQDLPGLLLIGIDSVTHQVMIWSGQYLQEVSTQDLINAINHPPPQSLVRSEK